MTNKEIAKVLKDEIIHQVKEFAKRENISKLANVLKACNLPDDIIPPTEIKIIERFPDPIGNQKYHLQIIQEAKEPVEYVIEKKHQSSHHKEQRNNYSLKIQLVIKRCDMENKEKDRLDLLDRLNRVRKEQAGICTSTCRSVIYSLMAASWAFWVKDGTLGNGLLISVFLLGCLYLILETGFCYYVAKKADRSYKSAKILCISTDDIEKRMELISDFTFRKIIYQFIYCLCLVVLFGYYIIKM